MNIVFGPTIAPRAWAIGESLLPRGFSIEILSTDDKLRTQQLERADFYMGFRSGLRASDYEHFGRI